ncbi:MAG: hypothetical protein ACI9MR_002211, partial [Myxococcota bacterium]
DTCGGVCEAPGHTAQHPYCVKDCNHDSDCANGELCRQDCDATATRLFTPTGAVPARASQGSDQARCHVAHRIKRPVRRGSARTATYYQKTGRRRPAPGTAPTVASRRTAAPLITILHALRVRLPLAPRGLRRGLLSLAQPGHLHRRCPLAGWVYPNSGASCRALTGRRQPRRGYPL